MQLASQIYVTAILVLQMLAEFSHVAKSEKSSQRNINAITMVFVALAIFLVWS